MENSDKKSENVTLPHKKDKVNVVKKEELAKALRQNLLRRKNPVNSDS